MLLPVRPFHLAVMLTLAVSVPSTAAVTGRFLVAVMAAATLVAMVAATAEAATPTCSSWPAINR
ncbi:hypothetical protein D3C78_762980 [compost metagenome]